ncbi:branched-chain amino acid ABC transporter permease [Marinobacter sp. LV10MA510-1]|uniref:branched-chain amino acid ABC transporter permease n=1 Tax=Marinobacter sp. LV10MA510-1 TaxID=1415567 RepID=UPI000BF739BD|nr:branched-chain amino acid ABC transporter permease [Marinobacter sp. LV10MA510-1]PFG09382.1 ABC-type branched-subunit amino acid transport system permease subunit [Marinobacter sp. LV10MA510-1]
MKKRLLIAGIVFLAVLGLSIAFPWMRVSLIMALVFGTAALGVVVLLRAGQISFGHAMYMLISGYTVAFLSEAFPGADGIVLVLAGTGVSLVTGMVLGLFLVRYRGIFFGMLNLAISMVIFTVVTKFYGLTGGSDGMRIPRPSLFGVDMDRAGYEATLLIILLVLAVALVFSVQQFFRSSAGEAMAAIKTNEDRLEYLGVSAKKLLWQGYTLSAGLCGLAGAFYGLSQGLVTPEAGYWLKSGELVFISILGGSAHAIGVFVAALLFEFVKLYASILVGGAWQLMLGVILIAIIYFLPDGLTSLFRKKRKTAEVRS